MVIISSLFPNPKGRNPFGEWVKIKNNSSKKIDINGYKIKDLSGKQFALKGILGPGEEKKLSYYQTKIILNNQNEVIFLYNNQGRLIDKLAYYKSYPNQIISGEENDWRKNILNESLVGQLNPYSLSKIILPAFLVIFFLTCLFFYLAKYILEKNENKNKIS